MARERRHASRRDNKTPDANVRRALLALTISTQREPLAQALVLERRQLDPCAVAERPIRVDVVLAQLTARFRHVRPVREEHSGRTERSGV